MKLIIALSGASGAIYGINLVKELIKQDSVEIFLIVNNAAKKVIEYECKNGLDEIKDKVTMHSENEIDAGVASSSLGTDAMVICPCSMKTIAAISVGYADNLITRCADVMIRERKKLILVPREMPLSEIHLENMLRLSRVGVTIMPACPGWYHEPKNLDDVVNFVVGKILDQLKIKNTLYKRWC